MRSPEMFSSANKRSSLFEKTKNRSENALFKKCIFETVLSLGSDPGFFAVTDVPPRRKDKPCYRYQTGKPARPFAPPYALPRLLPAEVFSL